MKSLNYKGNSSKTGIYIIKNIINNKIYVGSTKKSFHSRKTKHFNALKNNYHYNDYLQSSWNKYGEDAFVFEVILFCKPDDCEKYEDFFIREYKSRNKKYGFNIKPVRNYNSGYSVSEDRVTLMSFRKKQRAKENGLIEKEKGLNKSILVYDIEGNFIEKAPSALFLREKYGWSRSQLSIILSKRKLYYNNHIIIFANDVLSKNDIDFVKTKLPKRIDVYDLDMNYLETFQSAKKAAMFLGCKEAEVRMCCLNFRNRIKNYKTKYNKWKQEDTMKEN